MLVHTLAGFLPAKPIFIFDSLPYGGDNDCTQLPENPDDYIFTPYVQALLSREGSKEMAAAKSLANEPPAPPKEACGQKHV